MGLELALRTAFFFGLNLTLLPIAFLLYYLLEGLKKSKDLRKKWVKIFKKNPRHFGLAEFAQLLCHSTSPSIWNRQKSFWGPKWAKTPFFFVILILLDFLNGSFF